MQKNLFSFFNKRAEGAAPSPSAGPGKPPPAKKAAAPKKAATTKKAAPKKTPPPKKAAKPSKKRAAVEDAAPKPAAAGKKARKATQGSIPVGSTVRVMWPADKKWYAGKVLTVDAASNAHTVEYENGDREDVDLDVDKVEVLELVGGTPASTRADREGSDSPPKPGKPGKRPRAARKRVVLESDSEEAEFDGDSTGDEYKQEASSSDDDDDVELVTDDDEPVEVEEPEPEPEPLLTPPKRSRAPPKAKATPRGQSPSVRASPSVGTPGVLTARGGKAVAADDHKHRKLAWLTKERRDGARRPPSHADYDPRTLYVPPDFAKKETPGHRVWWEFKSKYMDVVLMFKVGKFYETYHMDADVLVKELDCVYMKGDHAHAGFPEIAYGRMSRGLVKRGYRVGRVEQTETPDMLKARNATLPKGHKVKVVRREMVNIKTPGTQTFNHMDAGARNPANEREDTIPPPTAAYLVSICEEALVTTDAAGAGAGTTHARTAASVGGDSQLVARYGVTLLDASTGRFTLAEFSDDRARSRLRTLFAQMPAAELVYARGGLAETTLRILRFDASDALVNAVPPAEFWAASRTTDELRSTGYFADGAEAEAAAFPELLSAVVERAGSTQDPHATNPAALALSALGGCMSYLRRCVMDTVLVSMGEFFGYKPAQLGAAVPGPVPAAAGAGNEDLDMGAGADPGPRHLILDGSTLINLEVLANSHDGTRSGTLLGSLERCLTAFGKRQFTAWLCAPLLRLEDIAARQDAVEALMGTTIMVEEARKRLRHMPDLERLLARIHTLGSKHLTDPSHPESRAIYYENAAYNKRKIKDFLSALRGFRLVVEIQQQFLEPAPGSDPDDPTSPKQLSSSITSPLLAKLLFEDFPNVSPVLGFFNRAFNQKKAEETGKILPLPGVDDAYDTATAAVADAEAALEEYLVDQRKAVRDSSIKYFHSRSNKLDRYQLEVSEATASRVPSSYHSTTQRKGFRRYHTDAIVDMVAALVKAEAERDEAVASSMQRLFARFDSHRAEWAAAASAIATLDCLMSLALWSAEGDGHGTMVRPEFVDSAAPFLQIREGRHPCLASTMDGGYVPNDTTLGTVPGGAPKGTCMLLTGPNMGGKSTLLRQACLTVVIAQLGAYVPAVACRLTPTDRIFTRVGASDRILAGQSTFFVELSETSSILRLATRRSLVILDELGRGTSTFDGNAIAYSVVKHLTQVVGARTMFATHYHTLCDEFEKDPSVSLGHMGCLAEEQPDGTSKVTFLYTFQDGACPKSYGLNVARLAHLPEAVITRAHQRSEEFEVALAEGHKKHAQAAAVQAALAAITGDAPPADLEAAMSQLKAAVAAAAAAV